MCKNRVLDEPIIYSSLKFSTEIAYRYGFFMEQKHSVLCYVRIAELLAPLHYLPTAPDTLPDTNTINISIPSTLNYPRE